VGASFATITMDTTEDATPSHLTRWRQGRIGARVESGGFAVRAGAGFGINIVLARLLARRRLGWLPLRWW